MPVHARSRLAVLAPAFVRVAVLVAIALAVGWLVSAEAGLWVAVIGLGLLLVVHLYYASLLAAWLEEPRLDDIPNGLFIWSDVFARLYRTRRTTERNERRLQDNEERFRRTISALPEGIVLVDLSLQIDWCNPVAEQHLGVVLSADHGLRVTNLVRDPVFVSYMTAGQFETPLVFRPMARPNTTLEVRVVEVERTRLMVISRDITQREQVDAMRRDFIANVSHELRTPLTVVNGFMEVLLDAEHQDEATRRHHLKLMREQAQRMSRLVEDLLTLSQLESSETPIADEVVDVQALMTQVAAEANALSNGRHRIELRPVRAFLRGNPEELRSAFGNLVSNAIRYTPEGGRITLAWQPDKDGGGRFEVADTGIGVAPEHVSRLTERFYRVDKSRSRETGGTGLGLAIVKHVLLRHDAQLDVDSEPGQGSTFAAVFPASRIVGSVAPAPLRTA
jgi:two-component system, OmpR family, phosphate regulon sensor histidine kinase PhoR